MHIKGLTPSVPLLSPSNQDQSGTQCFQNGTTTRAPPSPPSPTAEITQERSSTSVDAQEELKSFLASVLDLFKQLQDGNTQGPTEGSRTQAQPVLAQSKPDPAKSNTITEGNAALLVNDTMSTVIKEVDPVPGCSLDSAQSLSGVEVSPTSVQSSSDPIQHEPSTDSLCHNQTTGSVALVSCPTPTVSAILNRQRIKALVDTGAAVSVIDENFLKEIYQGHLPPLQKHSSGDVKTVSGAPLPVSGTFTTTLEIANGLYSSTFLVVRDLTYDALLGRDFLRANGAVINLKDSTLQLEESIARPHSEGACPVRVLYNCVIPASSEAVIPAYLDQTYTPRDVGFVEASPRLIERYQLQGAASLVTVSADHTVPFRLINPTRKPVTLYRGVTLVVPDVPVDLANADLTDSQKTELQRLINEYRDVFALSPQELGRTNLVQHHINTGDHPPIRQRAYRVPEAQKRRIEQCIDEMLEQDIIQPSTSPWSSPVVLVRKPDGSDRFCVDFRKVNSVTKKDSYPLPRIAETLDVLHGAQFMSSLDFRSDYWQISMDPSSTEKTAFISHAGLYEFNVMAFGLCNAPSCFQSLMECVLRGLTWKIALIYLDDVLVYSRTFDADLEHLRLVFDRFREAGLKLKPSKCHFGQKKVKFLGHVISKDGVLPDPDKVSAIKEYPVPRSVKDVRAFLGLANYYRKFVKDFAKIAGPLHDLTKKGLKFQWSDACQSAFETLKEALTQAPILAYPDFTLEFTLATDASDHGLGYVLGQVQNGREVVIAYGGRKLLPAEKNYSVTEREALAVVAGIKHYQHYLYGARFKVLTDHSAVRWLMSLKMPCGRLARWALLLQQYDFDIIHRAGVSNGNADALSRRSCDTIVAAIDNPGVQVDRVHYLQRQDPALADTIDYLE